MPSVVPSWEEAAANAQDGFSSSLASFGFKTPVVSPKTLDVRSVSLEDCLTEQESAITEASVDELVSKLQSREWSSEEVTVRRFLALLPCLILS